MKRSIIAITITGLLAACGGASPHDEAVLDTGTESALSPLVRTDLTGWAEPHPGHWGEWQAPTYCSPGMFAIGYRLRSEPFLGAGTGPDDTALNAVDIFCAGSGVPYWAENHAGEWGEWGPDAKCVADGYLYGAKIRVESPQGPSTDDFGATNVQFACSKGGYLQAGVPADTMNVGVESEWSYCPVNSVVCGIQSRFEESQGRGDDTALNAIRLACCAQP